MKELIGKRWRMNVIMLLAAGGISFCVVMEHGIMLGVIVGMILSILSILTFAIIRIFELMNEIITVLEMLMDAELERTRDHTEEIKRK